MKNYYITTTLPYVNAEPHIGFALEIVQADVIARYHKLLGNEVVFNTGTDEHGLKIYRKAVEENMETQAYCDKYAAKFHALKEALNLSYTNFIRTTDDDHIKATQDFWMLCFENGDIEKRKYHVKYCVGCELEKTESELVEGKCSVHPNLKIEQIDEENYFFKFSNYQKKLLKLYEDNQDFVVPSNRLEEIKNFIKNGAQDFSVSRLKAKMPWGVEVPNDPDHVMYVWFDALVNYISTLGWSGSAGAFAKASASKKATPDKHNEFEEFWPGVQVAGKDNLRQQSSMWQAMLMSAKLPTSKQIFIHGFITSGGQKMSKSLGNVVDPMELVSKYGTDAVRYYLLGALPSYDDGDFTIEKFEEFYTAHLVNGVGNLTSRIITMLEKYSESEIPHQNEHGTWSMEHGAFWSKYENSLYNYKFQDAVSAVNNLVANLDGIISAEKPWEKTKKGEDISGLLYQLAEGLRHIGLALLPIIPATAEKILEQLGVDVEKIDFEKDKEWGGLKSGAKIKKNDILFPRLPKIINS